MTAAGKGAPIEAERQNGTNGSSTPRFGEVAALLAENGYEPLPVHFGQKKPSAGKEWQHYKFSEGDAERFADDAVGILTGNVVAPDIDVHHEGLSRQCEKLAVSMFGQAPRRVGNAPKVLLLMRAEAPFTKLQTRGYRLPGDAPEDKPHKVEILAQGQQFVAFNIHEDTGRPYEWNGIGDPLTVPIGLLPLVSEAGAREYIAAAEKLLAEHGRPVGRLTEQDEGRAHEPNEEQRASEPALLRQALEVIPNPDLDFDDWLRVLYATKGALGEDGLDDFLRWSAKSSKDKPEFSTHEYRAALPKKCGAGTIYYLAQLEGWKRPQPGKKKSKLLQPLPCARAFVDAEYTLDGERTLLFWQDQFLTFRGDVWTELSISEVRAGIYGFLERRKLRAVSARVSEVLDALKSVVILPWRTQPPCWLDDPERSAADLLICRNGAFDLATGTRHPLTPRLFSRIALPVPYEPTAPAPAEWLKFLRSLWPDDSQNIATLQEIMGLLLTPNTVFQKLFLLVGPRRSGKGTILRTVTAIIGTDNTAAPTLLSLSSQFGLQPLIGKLAALISDARLGSRADQASIAERLLSISGEDNMGIPRKFLPDYTGRVGVRFVLSSNELPRLADASGALASRFIVLVMRESFLGREDLGLEQRIRSELSGILNWCLEGRQRLLARGYFVQPAASADTLRELEDLSSPVKAFLRDRCSIAPALTITPEALYTAWRGWCESTGRDKPGTLQSFGKDLRAALAWLQTSMPRGPDGKQRRVYEGIGLATPDTRTRTDTRKSPLPAVTPFSPSVPSSSPDSPDSIYARNAEMRVSPSVRPCPACGGEGCEWCQEASP